MSRLAPPAPPAPPPGPAATESNGAPTVFSQDTRPLRVATPLAKDTLLLETVVGAEELSRLYRFELGMLAEEDKEVPFDRLLGQPVTVELGEPDGAVRFIHGIVCEFARGDRVAVEGGGSRFVRYKADVVPQVWLLTRVARSRIFQQKSVPDILTAVFQSYPVAQRLQGQYPPRDYCVQYRETDFDFASRLMEEEGIYYFFEHASGKHTMVLADTPQGHPDVPDPASVPFVAGGSAPTDSDTGEVILEWEKKQAIRSGKVTLWDYSFEMPERTDHLAAVEAASGTAAIGTVSHSRTAGGAADLELYDHPGGYAGRFDGITPGGGKQPAELNKIMPDGKRTAAVRLKEETWPGVTVEGASDVRRLTPGHKFTLRNHPDADGAYTLVRVEHAASIEGAYTAGEAVVERYLNRFVAIPAAVPYSPPRRTPKPLDVGLQTAKVVGPSGQEIFCDPYGRVKVQFHWDREGKYNESSSCWIRVATPWAGQQWGMIQIPRIGQEVVVGFEAGDPDQPVILGGVYNAALMPPYELAKFQTKCVWKSRSTPNGTAENFNELRFEDKKDEEDIYFHAERDFHRVVENNDDLKVGFEKKTDGDQKVQIFNNQALFVGAGKADCKSGDRSVDVFNNETVVVGSGKADCKDGSQSIDVFNNQVVVVGSGKGNAKDGSQTLTVYKDRTTTILTGDEKLTVREGHRLVDVAQGNDTHKVQQGNRLVEVGQGHDTHNIKVGDRKVEIGTGNDTLTINTGNQTTKVSLGASKTEAMQSIELKVGGNSIKIDQSGITLTGMQVKIQGQVQVQLQAPITQVNGDGMVMIKGGVVMVN